MEEYRKIESQYDKLNVNLRKSQRNSEKKLIEVNNLMEYMKTFKADNSQLFD